MKTHLGEQLSIDLDNLIDTRLLVQANSGGGKSWAIRKLLETTHGKVQQIILDIEGDFPSLREKFDFILAGKGGDIPANPRSAELLARKILELKADLIVDLYELKQHERIRFVKLFLDAMINAPKDLWHPVIVVVDEAHIFAPEKGQAESMGAVIDLCTRGRKRGYCAVLATQRLSKLHKDAAAECNNKLIGRTGLDIDLKRAADELGMNSRDALILRDLEPGEFFAYGPAISKTIKRTKIGQVSTNHPKAGRRGLSHNPSPTEKVKKILGKLTDLPKEAEEELKDRESLKARVRELETELRKKSVEIPRPVADERAIERVTKKVKAEMRQLLIKELEQFLSQSRKALTDFAPSQAGFTKSEVRRIAVQPPAFLDKPGESLDGLKIGQCERRILGFLRTKQGEALSKVQIGAMTGYRHSSGGFNNALSKLAKANLIVRRGSDIELNQGATAEIDSLIGNEVPHRLEDWINKLSACERSIYQKLLEEPGRVFSKQEMADETGYSAGSGGFNNALSRLNTLGLMRRNGGGEIELNSEVSRLAVG